MFHSRPWMSVQLLRVFNFNTAHLVSEKINFDWISYSLDSVCLERPQLIEYAERPAVCMYLNSKVEDITSKHYQWEKWNGNAWKRKRLYPKHFHLRFFFFEICEISFPVFQLKFVVFCSIESHICQMFRSSAVICKMTNISHRFPELSKTVGPFSIMLLNALQVWAVQRIPLFLIIWNGVFFASSRDGWCLQSIGIVHGLLVIVKRDYRIICSLNCRE